MHTQRQLGLQEGDAQHHEQHEVADQKGAAAVLVVEVREAPHISQANERAGAGEDEGGPGRPPVTFRWHCLVLSSHAAGHGAA
jgi:hypothetical protein